MTTPKFHIRQHATATINGVEGVPVRIVGVEPGEGARGFANEPWVYHVHPEGSDFGVNVGESALQPPTS